MPSDEIQLCSASGARPGMADNVRRAFQLHAANRVDDVLSCADEGLNHS